jgi:hypothetical protein
VAGEVGLMNDKKASCQMMAYFSLHRGFAFALMRVWQHESDLKLSIKSW